MQGASQTFNPTLADATIAAQRAADPTAAGAEWDAHSASTLAPSWTTHDASTVAIVHVEGEGDNRRYVADVVRGRKGDPVAAVHEFVELARQYHCSVITGDNYAAEWVAGSFREAGCEYHQSKLVRSELYLAGLPLFTRGVVGIPNLAQLLRELRLLERRTARSGRDTVDHGVGGSDDYANALFGALHLAASVPVNREPTIVVPFIGPIYNPVREAFRPAW